jgi:tRNA threonylcarbamoyladenosine biosynthesis protein TsaE
MTETYSLDNISDLAARILAEYSSDYSVWTFKGDLGAGKTTLIKELCSQLGAVDAMNSPSFALVNEYETHGGELIYHCDFYRIREPEEATHLGVEEHFYSGDTCFIEWPEMVEHLIPDRYLEINIKLVGSNERAITVDPHGGET